MKSASEIQILKIASIPAILMAAIVALIALLGVSVSSAVATEPARVHPILNDRPGPALAAQLDNSSQVRIEGNRSN
jgi:hypothetical protein